MPLVVVDEPPDRPDFIRETVELLAARLEEERRRLLERVGRATDAELSAGTDQEWGIGQVAAHLLIVERGVLGIALRLAKGEAPTATGQPRPAAAEVSRGRIEALAERTRRASERFRAGFPAQPDDRAMARHPFYGDMNCFGWLLTLPNHYYAHLSAHDRGVPSAL
jgi:hypothetical protein